MSLVQQGAWARGLTLRTLIAPADVVVLLLDPSCLDSVDATFAPDTVADAEIDGSSIFTEPDRSEEIPGKQRQCRVRKCE